MIVFRWIGYAAVAFWIVAAAVKGCQALLAPAPPDCAATLQAFVSELSPEHDPVVQKCAGPANNSLCFVSSLDDGIRKTYPFRWNCVTRQLVAKPAQ